VSVVDGVSPDGVPVRLPGGERMLWQGRPRWRSLARRAFHVRKVAAYFALLGLWRVADGAWAGEGAGGVASGLAILAAVAACSIGLLGLLAWLFARTTVYTITSRRVVIRFGVALPMSVNIPFAQVGSAGLMAWPDGTGDIPLQLTGQGRIAYLHLWPNVRRWRFTRPEPMLRNVPDAERVAGILARALVAHHGGGEVVEPARARPSGVPAPTLAAA
jgi:hypothetical protein